MPVVRALVAVFLGAVALASDAAPQRIDPPARSARAGVRLAAVPWTIANACRSVQARSSSPVLCPARLPRATLGWPPGAPPPTLVATVIGSGRPGEGPLGLDIGYGAPWEADPGFVTKTQMRAHAWRNRPCCFLHADVERMLLDRVPDGARPAVVGGVRGRLLGASGKYFDAPYFGNHVRFFFRRRGIEYVATLHTFGERETEALLGRIVRGLRAGTRAMHPRGTYVGIGAAALAPDHGAVWATSLGGLGRRGALSRLDADTGRLRTTVHGCIRPLDVAVGAGGLWAVGYSGGGATAVRVEPRTGSVTARVATGRWPRALAAGARGVWVINSSPFLGRGSLVRVDPATNRLSGAPTHLGRAPARIALGRGSAWITDALDGTVTRVALGSRRVVTRIATGRAPWGVAVGAAAVWVSNVDDGTVSRIEPGRNRVAATIRVGRNPHGIAVGGGAVWVANLGDGTVSRIDPHTDRARVWARVGGDPLAVAVAHGSLWVTVNSDGTVRRLPLGR